MVVSLAEAKRLAPAIVHGHYYAKQIIGDLLALADETSADLRGLAVSIGLLPAR